MHQQYPNIVSNAHFMLAPIHWLSVYHYEQEWIILDSTTTTLNVNINQTSYMGFLYMLYNE